MSKCVLPGWETSTPEEQIQALRKTFQRVFKSEDGKVVLNALLTDLFYFDAATSEAEKALCEYAKFLLRERLGCNKTFALTGAIVAHLD